MPSDRRKKDSLSSFLDTGDDPRRRRRVAGAPGAGPSGPALRGGPSGPDLAGGPSGPALRGLSGPALSGGPSGPALSGGAKAPGTSRRRRPADDDLLKQLYG
ncbi:MAG: hypothetical protein GX595_15915 [Lentisphaerae bacterium]|nr:hypothetical protein [Lentisphaerota bacterium]